MEAPVLLQDGSKELSVHATAREKPSLGYVPLTFLARTSFAKVRDSPTRLPMALPIRPPVTNPPFAALFEDRHIMSISYNIIHCHSQT